MEDLSLHILDIVENSIRADAKNIKIKLIENREKDLLTLEIKDDGKGMSRRIKKKSTHPFFTTKEGKKVGLGLSLLAQSAQEADGKLKIKSEKGKGTEIIVSYKLNHIDRKPLGNIEETINCLRVTHPEINFFFEHLKIHEGKKW